MTIIVEDGTLVANANSLISVVDFEAHAEARGITIVDSELALIKAMDYLNAKEPQLKGDLVKRDQSIVYPRDNLSLEGFIWSPTEIPRQAINTQIALAIEVDAGEDLDNETLAALPVVGERVEGAIDVTYANPTRVDKVNKKRPSDVLVRVLMKNNGLMSVRA